MDTPSVLTALDGRSSRERAVVVHGGAPPTARGVERGARNEHDVWGAARAERGARGAAVGGSDYPPRHAGT